VDCKSFHCGLQFLAGLWLGWGQRRQPGGKPPGLLPPSAQSAQPWGWGQTRATGASPRGAWATPPQARSTTPPGAWSAYS